MNYFEVEQDKSSEYTGFVDGMHKWALPGLICPACKATWSGGAKEYPSVDLTPVAALADFIKARPEPIEEYERMCELVRPLLPEGATLEPGAALGPFVGRPQGHFGLLSFLYTWRLAAQRQALEQLQAEGVRGLKGCRMELRIRQRNFPELLELELLPAGRLHSDCLPRNRRPPCARCGRHGLTLPSKPILDGASLPAHLDVFRLDDFPTVIVCTQRFVDACERLGLDGVTFQPLPVR